MSGQQPFNPVLRAALANLLEKREPNEVIVIHHFTDTKKFLQLEVERRSTTLGIAFERRRL